jgi:hypothetical protein
MKRYCFYCGTIIEYSTIRASDMHFKYCCQDCKIKSNRECNTIKARLYMQRCRNALKELKSLKGGCK